MSPDPATPQSTPVGAPSQHYLALMIWLAVMPTPDRPQPALSGPLQALAVVPRTVALATIAVPIVIYGLMPQLHRIRTRLLTTQAQSTRSRTASDISKGAGMCATPNNPTVSPRAHARRTPTRGCAIKSSKNPR